MAAGHRGAIVQLDFLQHTGRGSRHLEKDFVGLLIVEIFIPGDLIAGFFMPCDQRGVSHRFRQLRHANFDSHDPVLV
ncbi:MAG: hypothetical protein NVSMB15_05060 [Steroidobacteraceae bacterium]